MQPSHTTTSRTRRTAEERRVDVLHAAIIEFSTHGFHGGSTETIATLAGISQPYVLRLFKTKKNLFLEALAQVCDTILSVWQRALKQWENQRDASTLPTVNAKLEAIGMAFYGLVESIVELRLVLQAFASAEDEDIRRQVQASLDQMFTWVRDATGADEPSVRRFFASGMMLTIAASIGAADVAGSQAWARAFLQPSL
jgi:AcrR family transcriptional regulator